MQTGPSEFKSLESIEHLLKNKGWGTLINILNGAIKYQNWGLGLTRILLIKRCY